MNIEEVVEQYIILRNEVAAKKKEFEVFKKEANATMCELEKQILAISIETGVESFKTQQGTAFRTTKTYASVISPLDRIEWVKKTGDFGLFTSHVNKRHVLELLEAGVDPSTYGVDLDSEQVIQFRKN